MKGSLKILISLLILSAIFGCKKSDEVFSNIPQIELSQFNTKTVGSEKVVEVAINFTDGDGDFGLEDFESTFEVDTILKVCTDTGIVHQVTKITKSINSLFAILKEKKNGTFNTAFITTTIRTDCEIRVDTTFLNQTLPRVEPRGDNKALKGTINTQFVIPVTYENGLTRDSTLIEIFIEDRAKNKSNTIATPVFAF